MEDITAVPRILGAQKSLLGGYAVARKRDAESGHCLLGVLAVALRQPDSRQVIPFKRVLECVRALVDFNMMAQYRSHTDETMVYMEDYLGRFHHMKDVFLEF